jgi:polysaccharide export outer membrane protein
MVMLAGCSALPSAGPTTSEVIANESTQASLLGYVVVDIDSHVVGILARRPRPSLYGMFKASDGAAPDVRIGVGDSVTVTIWEAGPGGLFSVASLEKPTASGSRTSTLPEQEVSQNGTIRVPYAGRIKVSGLRPADVETLIVKDLQGKAIEPQAVVTISKKRSSAVTVTGEVTNGMLIPVSVRGDRILDVIAAAGGIRAAAHESFVRLTRGTSTATVPFDAILADSRENVYVRPGDVLTVVREVRRFTAFGGTGRNELVHFDGASMSLEQAIAKAGGLLDFRADPAGVFLLRFEPANLVAEFAPERKLQFESPYVPVVYRLNLRDASSYFLARAFPMHDKDILYVANAPMTEVQKALAIIGTVTGPVIAGAAVYNATR